MRAALLIVVAACSSSPTKPTAPVAIDAELSPALAPLAWWVGDWRADDGSTEHWVAASGALYGIALQDGRFESMIVDDGEAPGKPDGIVRFIAMPGGAKAVEFQRRTHDARSITFANDAHDFPKAITYTREGNELRALVGDGTKSDRFRFTQVSTPRARELEAADIAFAKDTAARGIEGWLAAFDAQGAMMSKAGRVEGAAAIRELMSGTLAKFEVEWVPIASARRGDLGYTVGKATFTAADGNGFRTTYVSIWKRQADGTWKVLFDTGRPVHDDQSQGERSASGSCRK